MRRYGSGPVERAWDETKVALTKRTMGMIEEKILSAPLDQDMPDCLQRQIRGAIEQAWPLLEEHVMYNTTWAPHERLAHKTLHKSVVRGWLKHRRCWPSGHWCPKPFAFVRSAVLYALLPADATVWYLLKHSWIFWLLMPLQFVFAFGANVWFFLLLFLLIDKRDEFQLIQFICHFKTIQALTCGVLPSVLDSGFRFNCRLAVSNLDHARTAAFAATLPFGEAGELDAGKEAVHQMGAAVKHGVLSALNVTEHIEALRLVHEECGVDAHSLAQHVEVYAEPARILTVWLAYALLRFGYARGGYTQLKVLEHVRTDAADGTLDGTGRREAKQQDLTGESVEVRFTATEERMARRAALHALDPDGSKTTRRHRKGILRVVMIFDIVQTICVFVYFGVMYLRSCGLEGDGVLTKDTDKGEAELFNACGLGRWEFMESMHSARIAQSLLSLPFIMFMLPLGIKLLTRAEPTAYDRSGMLVMVLPPALRALRDKMTPNARRWRPLLGGTVKKHHV